MQYDLSFFQEDRFIQDVFDIRDQMRTDQDGRFFVIVGDDRIQDIISGSRVHTRDRLIQKIQFRMPGHRQDELDFFFRALGHFLHRHLHIDIQCFQHLHGTAAIEIGIEIFIEIQKIIAIHPIRQIVPIRQIRDQRL